MGQQGGTGGVPGHAAFHRDGGLRRERSLLRENQQTQSLRRHARVGAGREQGWRSPE